MQKTCLTLLLCAGLVGAPGPASAQPTSDPNLRNFYMGRQQVTITDDSPIVNDQRTNPAAAGGGGGRQRRYAGGTYSPPQSWLAALFINHSRRTNRLAQGGQRRTAQTTASHPRRAQRQSRRLKGKACGSSPAANRTSYGTDLQCL